MAVASTNNVTERKTGNWEHDLTRPSGDERLLEALTLGYDGLKEEAVAALRAMLNEEMSDEDRGWILLYEARFLGYLRRLDEAKSKFAHVRKLWPNAAQYVARIDVGEALLHEAMGKPQLTLKEMDGVLRKYADQWSQAGVEDLYWEVQSTRGRLLIGQNRWRAALPLLEETQRLPTEKPAEFYFNLGYCYFMNGDWQKSARAFREALTGQIHPVLAAESHYYLGRLERRNGTFAQAITELEAAEKLAVETGRPL